MKGFLLALLFIALSASTVYSQSSGSTSGSYSLTADSSAFYSWIPVIIIAVFVGVGITLLYYAAATFLGNSRLKASAMNEFTQVTGTVVVLVIILMILNIYGSAVYSGDSTLTTNVQNICNQLKGSPLNFTNASIQGPTSSVCSQIINGGSSSSSSGGTTQNIDFGLGETYVIIANLTNQTAFSLNVLNVFENYFYSLSFFEPTESVCWPETVCVGYAYGGESATYTYMPFQFYGKIRGGTIFVTTEAQLAFYINMLQLLLILLVLFGWPYLLAAGLILRATVFTRRAGGLIISMVLVAMFLYPILTLFEYSSLTNATSPLVPIGLNATAFNSTAFSSMIMYGQKPSGTLQGSVSSNGLTSNPNPVIAYGVNSINFYVFPRLDYVLNYYGCWPPNGSVLWGDTLVAGTYSIPGYGLFLAVKDFIGSFAGSLPSPNIPSFNCIPANLEKAWVELSNFYGQVFVFSLLIPIFNILMLLSAVKGVSTILGGDTSLLGLSRLL